MNSPLNRRLLFGSLAVVALAIAAIFGASRAAAAGRMHLEFTPGDMGVAVIGGKNGAAWYLPYTLRNPMDAAQRPAIRLELRTENKKTFGDAADPRVTRMAEKATGKHGMKSTTDLRADDLAAGASADALANFGWIDPQADELTVRVYGLWDPVIRTKQNKVLREIRVLVLKYSRPGDEYDRQDDPIKFVSRTEEIEGDVTELYSNAPEKKK